MDDIAGGQATISYIEQWGNGNYFVGFSELAEGKRLICSYLLKSKTEWAAEYGEQMAQRNSNLRPEFNTNYGSLHRSEPPSDKP